MGLILNLKDWICFNIHTYFSFQGLPITEWEHIDENTGSWETVFIPVNSPHYTSPRGGAVGAPHGFSVRATYTLKNLRSGAVYDIVAKAKNKFGWSQLSKVFNFFNKGVGKYYMHSVPKEILCQDCYQELLKMSLGNSQIVVRDCQKYCLD